MKPIHIDDTALLQAAPPPSPAFLGKTMALLTAKTKEQEEKMKRKLPTAILVAALLMAALMATAFSMGLFRTAEVDAVAAARQALMDTYDHTLETIGCFNYSITKEGETYEVVFQGYWDAAQIGTYHVTLKPGHDPLVTWSHDGVDPALWQGDDLDAHAWGPEQIRRIMAMSSQERVAFWGKGVAPKTEAFGIESPPFLISTLERYYQFQAVLPKAGDMGEERALAVAKEGLMARYGLPDSALPEERASIALVIPVEAGVRIVQVEGGVRQYVITWPLSPHSGTAYAMVGAGDGQLLTCFYDEPGSKRYLPEGRLGDYPIAMAEYLSLGAFDVKAPEERMAIMARMEAEGLGDWVARVPMESASWDSLDREALTAIAEDAMGKAYGFTAETLALFDAHVAWAEDTALITYYPRRVETGWGWNWDLFVGKGMGRYTAAIAPGAASIPILWSHAGIPLEGEYGIQTWGSASAYTANMLPWALDLRVKMDAVTAGYPKDTSIYEYAFEDRAAFDTLFREAGFDANQFSNTLPGPEDLSYQDALALAKEAVLREMPEAAAHLGDAYMDGDLDGSDPDGPVWRFSIQFEREDVYMDFGIAMDGRTGEVQLLNVVTGINP